MIVIPAIDLISGQCVRLYQGDFGQQTTYRNDPVEQGRDWLNALHWLQAEPQCDTDRIGVWVSTRLILRPSRRVYCASGTS